MAVIFHLDLDSFFVSVERILDPRLNGKPVIVGGDPKGRGVVAACSYEAREYGLSSAMPIRQAYQLCPKGIYIHGHYEEYERYSNLVKEILLQFTPCVEQASIDEFYLDFSSFKYPVFRLLMISIEIKNTISRELELPASIGIAPNKLLAKICSDFNKPNGMTIVVEGKEQEFLNAMPIKSMPGIGKVLQKDLNDKGFYQIGDIAKTPVEFFSARYGKVGIDLWNKAHGEGETRLSRHTEQKSISKENTFQKDIISSEKLKEILLNLTGKVAQKLRSENITATTITVKLRYSDFVTVSKSRTIPPVADDFVIFDVAKKLLTDLFKRRVGVRLIGIRLSNFRSGYQQQNLFDFSVDKRKNLFDAISKLRLKHGYKAVTIGTIPKRHEPEEG